MRLFTRKPDPLEESLFYLRLANRRRYIEREGYLLEQSGP